MAISQDNKVNRSLKKLQGVIESVKGVEGAFKIETLKTGLVSSTMVPNKVVGNNSLVQGKSFLDVVEGAANHVHDMVPLPTNEEVTGMKTTLPRQERVYNNFYGGT